MNKGNFLDIRPIYKNAPWKTYEVDKFALLVLVRNTKVVSGSIKRQFMKQLITVFIGFYLMTTLTVQAATYVLGRSALLEGPLRGAIALFWQSRLRMAHGQP